MRVAIVLWEFKGIPDLWTKEDVAGYLNELLSNPRNTYSLDSPLKGSFAAIKIFEVSE